LNRNREPPVADVAPTRTSPPRRIAIALAFGIGGAVALVAAGSLKLTTSSDAARAQHPVWSEVPWPFPMDEWGRGKAYRCPAANCGAEVNVYLRAKIGFCNCTGGIADDEELERLSDFHLTGGQVTALKAGQPITVGWMKGRSRPYQIANAKNNALALSTAFHNECDALVGTAVFDRERIAEIEPAVIGFLNSQTALDWARVELGL
jgi:hypothetical protein